MAGQFLQHVKRLGVTNFAIDAGINYAAYKMEGRDNRDALLRGIGTSVAMNLAGPVGNILMGVGTIGAVGMAAYEAGRGRWYKMMEQNYTAGQIGGGYVDTKAAYTMRQAAVQALQQSRINGNMVLGNEASFLHK